MAYAIDPDGSGAQAPFLAYCDMTTNGGGWTLIQSHVAGTATSSTPASSVGLGSARYLALAPMQALANLSTTVRIDDATRYLESADSYPITRLRAGAILNDDATKTAVHWSGTGTANMVYSCITTSSLRYPAIYWACGNGVGMHVLAGNPINYSLRSFTYNPSSTAINVWVR